MNLKEIQNKIISEKNLKTLLIILKKSKNTLRKKLP